MQLNWKIDVVSSHWLQDRIIVVIIIIIIIIIITIIVISIIIIIIIIANFIAIQNPLFQTFNRFFQELRLDTLSYWNKLLNKKIFWHRCLLKKLNSLEWLGNGLEYLRIAAYLNKISIKNLIDINKNVNVISLLPY